MALYYLLSPLSLLPVLHTVATTGTVTHSYCTGPELGLVQGKGLEQ